MPGPGGRTCRPGAVRGQVSGSERTVTEDLVTCRDRPSGCAPAAQVAERLPGGVGTAHAMCPGAGRRRR